MLTFIAFYLWQVGSFVLNAKEFKHLYLDNRDIFEYDSSDEEKTNSDEEMDDSEGDNISSENDDDINKIDERMEVIYIS